MKVLLCSTSPLKLEGVKLSKYIDINIDNLNDSSNDEIPLKGGQNIRDIIGSDTFELEKIYHKTTGSGKTSQITLWAIKR